MRNKTAMMELKELVNSNISSDELGWWLSENMDMLLEKEKEQIMDAYEYGCHNGDLDGSEQWYNQTYLKEEQQ